MLCKHMNFFAICYQFTINEYIYNDLHLIWWFENIIYRININLERPSLDLVLRNILFGDRNNTNDFA